MTNPVKKKRTKKKKETKPVYIHGLHEFIFYYIIILVQKYSSMPVKSYKLKNSNTNNLIFCVCTYTLTQVTCDKPC